MAILSICDYLGLQHKTKQKTPQVLQNAHTVKSHRRQLSGLNANSSCLSPSLPQYLLGIFGQVSSLPSQSFHLFLSAFKHSGSFILTRLWPCSVIFHSSHHILSALAAQAGVLNKDSTCCAVTPQELFLQFLVMSS